MLSYLAELHEYFGPLRLFGYITFRCVAAAATSLVIGFLMAPWMMNNLRLLKVKQTLRDASEVGKLADLHAEKKDTPTMGGLIIYIALLISVVLWAKPNVFILCCLCVYSGLTLLGFADDYLKVSRKHSGGLASRYKMLGQAVITIILVLMLLTDPISREKVQELWIPFLKFPLIETMPIWFILIFFYIVLSGSSNAINLTDGIDGLAIGCTVTVALVYGIMAYAAGNYIISDYLFISFIPGTGELAIICSALVGASLAFLWYNAHPAEVFMGDTGSLALGGLIGTVALLIHQPITLVIVGGIFVMEAMSVIIQVFSYKIRKKRVFRMAPIHHHFELKGWPEIKVVIRFWILSLLFALSGLATLKLR